MSGNGFGVVFRVSTFGESHGPALGAVVDGVPAGLPLDEAMIQRELDRRRPGRSPLHSRRDEPDRVQILSGLYEGQSTGAPIGILVHNCDARSADYQPMQDVFRPGHADFTWYQRFGIGAARGGGRASGRETVARVAAGAIAKALLATAGIAIRGVVKELAGIPAQIDDCDWEPCADLPLRCPDERAAAAMSEAIVAAQRDGDSVGGVIEVRATGCPIGLGEPVFDKLDARLAAAVMSIGAVKGVELGDGFALARLRGSTANDQLRPPAEFLSNRAGGVLGGLSTGAPIVLRAAVKPTPSIAKVQRTVDRRGQAKELTLTGRHDPCIAPRAVAVVEAMVALVLADAWLLWRARRSLADLASAPGGQ